MSVARAPNVPGVAPEEPAAVRLQPLDGRGVRSGAPARGATGAHGPVVAAAGQLLLHERRARATGDRVTRQRSAPSARGAPGDRGGLRPRGPVDVAVRPRTAVEDDRG